MYNENGSFYNKDGSIDWKKGHKGRQERLAKSTHPVEGKKGKWRIYRAEHRYNDNNNYDSAINIK